MAGILAKGIVAPIRPNVYDLVSAHAAARGVLVDNPEEAHMVFTSALPGRYKAAEGQKVITAYDAETLIADFLQ